MLIHDPMRSILHTFGALVSEAMVGTANSMQTVKAKQISLSIRAFGQLAPAIPHYHGAQRLKAMLKRMVIVSKKVFDVSHANADAGMGGDGAMLEQLSAMCFMVFDGFHSMWRRLIRQSRHHFDGRVCAQNVRIEAMGVDAAAYWRVIGV